MRDTRRPTQRRILAGSRWWRASAYEVVGGTHIAPAKGSEILEFDPLELNRKREPPYAELLRLSASDPEGLRRWAGRFGLLGILLHQTVEAMFWPRWEGAGLMQRQYTAGQPITTARIESVTEIGHGTQGPIEPEELRFVLQKDYVFWKAIRAPGVRYIEPHSGVLKQAEGADGYGQFFPRVPGVCEYTDYLWKVKYPLGDSPAGPDEAPFERLGEELNRAEYPEPLSERFLREYGEPIRLMQTYIWALHQTVNFWDRAGKASSIQELDSITREMQADVSLPPSFAAGLSAVHPTVVPSERKWGGVTWKPGWESRSLYGSLNVRLLDDFALRGARTRTCAHCTRLFVTTREKKEYCSSRCRKAAQMARYRELGRSQKREVQKNLEGST